MGVREQAFSYKKSVHHPKTRDDTTHLERSTSYTVSWLLAYLYSVDLDWHSRFTEKGLTSAGA